MDAREVNKLFAPPKIYLPHFVDPLEYQGKRWYAKIDISEAFMHLKFSKSMSQWFSFTYGGKEYYWQRMGFGWDMAPYLFQTVIQNVLSHLK